MASTELRAAAQQALEALEGGADSWQRVGPAIDALKAALAEPVQEPVLQALADADRIMGHDDESTEWRERWAHLFSCALTNGGYQCSCGASQKVHRPAPPQRPAEPVAYSEGRTLHWHDGKGVNDAQLYLAPPQRKPLTEEEIMQCFDEAVADYVDVSDAEMVDFARAIERAHGIGGKE